MTHALVNVHYGPHIYGPEGIGELEHDPAEHLTSGSDKILETRDLPGFIYGGVTYESHHFWVHFVGGDRIYQPTTSPATERRPTTTRPRSMSWAGTPTWKSPPADNGNPDLRIITDTACRNHTWIEPWTDRGVHWLQRFTGLEVTIPKFGRVSGTDVSRTQLAALADKLIVAVRVE